MKYSKYIQLWVLTSVILLLLASVFNYIVDPYGMFGTERIAGLNYLKPAAGDHARIAKPYQVGFVNPRTVIIGNSRPEIGIDPRSVCWPPELQPVYNLGIPGASVYMSLRSLQHTASYGNLRHVFWGLDFRDFLQHVSADGDSLVWPPRRLMYENRLRVELDGSRNSAYRWNKARDFLNSMLSLDALVDSLYTIMSQVNPSVPSTRADGFNTARDIAYAVRLEGQDVIFKQKNIGLSDMFFDRGRYVYRSAADGSKTYESVRWLLQRARHEYGMDVVLFINPYHSDYLAILYLAGWWDAFEDWKRSLTRLAERHGAELWDFTGINMLSTEQPPLENEHETRLEWFWEPAHYSKEYGELMLQALLHTSCSKKPALDVGRKLGMGNIEQHLREQRNAIERYVREHPRAFDRLRAAGADG